MQEIPIDFKALNARIEPLSANAMARSVEKWNDVAKPIGALGDLETAVTHMAGIMDTPDVCISKRCVIPMCSDNGVLEEGVSQSDQEVTALVASNMAKGISSVCVMAKVANIDVIPVDVGIAHPLEMPNMVQRNVMRCTNNISKGPAMTREQACQGIQVGMDMVVQLAAEGYQLFITGEMGVGNTTTSAALSSALLALPVESVTGRGSGLSNAGLAHKREVIERALSVNKPDPNDPLDCLAKVGGLDIAGMVGTYLGAALCRKPVLIDGLISAIAALIAARLCPACTAYMMASHVSAEPAAVMILEELGLRAPISAGLRLGEGTGAVCLVPLLDMSLALYNGTSFLETGMEAYDAELSSK